MQLLSVLQTIFWGLVVLSLLVYIHEAGHYLAAHLFGVRVTEFFLGMPCRFRAAFRSKKYGTLVGVTPLLLGGYTRICGMEGTHNDQLAEAFACVCAHGRIKASDLAAELGCDEAAAYDMLATLSDWAAVEPYYDSALGEHEGQSEWPESFQTVARDAAGRTNYDVGHDFSRPGAHKAGDPYELSQSAEAALEAERSHTYLGCSFPKRLVMLVAGPFFNFVLAIALLMCIYCILGITVGGQHITIAPGRAFIASLRYSWAVIGYVVQLLMPAHTMEVLNNSTSVVGISIASSQAAAAGLDALVGIIASVSMSLCFMNLLPIPPLDGGKILIETIQALLRRPLSRRAQAALSYVGIAFFLFVFIYVLRLDVLRFFV